MWRISVLLLICLVAVPAYSNPPSPAPPKTEQKNQADPKNKEQPAGTDQRSTEGTPVFIKAIPAPPVEPRPAEHAQEPNWYTSPEWWLVLVTVILGAITAILAGYTAKLWGATKSLAEEAKQTADRQAGEMQETLRIGRESSKAATDTANAITSSERAYVFAKVKLPGGINPSHEGTAITPAMALFVNHGKTPAIIINMSGAPYLTDEVPQQLHRTPGDDRRFHEGWVIASEGAFQFPIEMRITNQQMGEIENGAKKLYCAGLIRYKDILDNERETGYCWEYLPEADRRFTFCEASRLNYYK
jgi:hypothetical protein